MWGGSGVESGELIFGGIAHENEYDCSNLSSVLGKGGYKGLSL